jgi:hypothetical protein
MFRGIQNSAPRFLSTKSTAIKLQRKMKSKIKRNHHLKASDCCKVLLFRGYHMKSDHKGPSIIKVFSFSPHASKPPFQYFSAKEKQESENVICP